MLGVLGLQVPDHVTPQDVQVIRLQGLHLGADLVQPGNAEDRVRTRLHEAGLMNNERAKGRRT